jgi:predicted phosphodiesterase
MLKPPFAVISDIHANLEAMEALHAEIHRQGIRQVVCLGDVVGYGPNPSETTGFVMAHATRVVAGNHGRAFRPFSPASKSGARTATLRHAEEPDREKRA